MHRNMCLKNKEKETFCMKNNINVYSEIGVLKEVLVHTPRR